MFIRLSLAVLLCIALAGCGGGGGGTQNASTPSLDNYAGIWKVENAGLPDDQLLIDNAGNVMVRVSATRSGAARYRIGECSSTGVIDVSGTWPISSGISRHIEGDGVVTTTKVTLSVLVKDGTTIIADGSIDGYELDAPPPVPYGNADFNVYEDLDIPPPLPY
ncbi:MAG: hypothetical protein ABFD54_04560 [Armatimonadota bacterium]